MKHRSGRLFAVGLLSLLASHSFAQPEDRSGDARAAMEALRPMAGEWIQQVRMWGEGEWSEPVEERATIHFMLEDLALREAVPEHSSSGVKMETTIQFDQYRGVYRLVALDNSWGNLDVYESTSIKPGQIVLDNRRAGTYALGANGEVYSFRLTFSIESAEAHRLLVEISGDGGKTWHNFQRLDRSRLQ